MDYGDIRFSPFDYRVIAGVAVTAWLAAYSFLKKEKNPLFFFSVGWFFLALVPVSDIYPVNAFYMAEHWLYLPSLGFFIILSKALIDIYAAKGIKFFALFCAAAIGYACLTILQTITERTC
jgi:hypothetical protein